MPLNKTKKRKKYSRAHGKGMGTAGGGARKKNKKSGHRGGTGMSGTGKRADHKKTKITKEFGHGYFGKKGFTSVGSRRDKRDRINLRQIEENLKIFLLKGIAKENKGKIEVNLSSYKILGDGELKSKLIIKAKEASQSAIDKIGKSGGEIILPKLKEDKTNKTEIQEK